ncbi:MAG: FtsK/SpoIIIE domain-containing protein [Christensenellales bacterium]
MFRRRKYYWHTPPLDILGGGVPARKPSITLHAPPTAGRVVTLRQTIATEHFSAHRTPSSAALGIDHDGTPVYIDIARMPHMLVAGATGSGKSVALDAILCSLLYCASPSQAQLILIDPKRVELGAYAGLSHLAKPIVTDTMEAIQTLRQVEAAMDQRYKAMSQGKAPGPRIVIVIDELADLMLTSRKTVEHSIVRIAQLGRAAGIHLILATQKPLVSVVTGLIQGNIPCKLALQTASTGDSVRILGHKGAEKLLGRGDALLKLPDRVEEIRLQCAYTAPEDIAAIVKYWKYDAKQAK